MRSSRGRKADAKQTRAIAENQLRACPAFDAGRRGLGERRPMIGEPIALAKLVSALLMAISGYTGYAVPPTQPAVSFLPAAKLEAEFCSGPCPVRAFFPPGQTIYLEAGMDVRHDPVAESILVHELTHWLQQENTGHREATDCEEWMRREYQAYDVQYRWLRDSAGSIREFSIRMAALGGRPVIPPCDMQKAGRMPAGAKRPLAVAPP
jgi:hypothetical protein